MGALEIKNKKLRCQTCLDIRRLLIIPSVTEPKIVSSCHCNKSVENLLEFTREINKVTDIKLVCSQCNKETIKHPRLCYDCLLVYCSKCYNRHLPNQIKDENVPLRASLVHHTTIHVEKLDYYCVDHQNNNFIAYCQNCLMNLCNECIKEGIHKLHHVDLFTIIKPDNKTKDELKNNIKNAQHKIERTKIKITNFCKENKDDDRIKEIEEKFKLIDEENNDILTIMKYSFNLYKSSKMKNYSIIYNLTKNMKFNLKKLKLDKTMTNEEKYKIIIKYLQKDVLILYRRSKENKEKFESDNEQDNYEEEEKIEEKEEEKEEENEEEKEEENEEEKVEENEEEKVEENEEENKEENDNDDIHVNGYENENNNLEEINDNIEEYDNDYQENQEIENQEDSLDKNFNINDFQQKQDNISKNNNTKKNNINNNKNNILNEKTINNTNKNNNNENNININNNLHPKKLKVPSIFIKQHQEPKPLNNIPPPKKIKIPVILEKHEEEKEPENQLQKKDKIKMPSIFIKKEQDNKSKERAEIIKTGATGNMNSKKDVLAQLLEKRKEMGMGIGDVDHKENINNVHNENYIPQPVKEEKIEIIIESNEGKTEDIINKVVVTNKKKKKPKRSKAFGFGEEFIELPKPKPKQEIIEENNEINENIINENNVEELNENKEQDNDLNDNKDINENKEQDNDLNDNKDINENNSEVTE